MELARVWISQSCMANSVLHDYFHYQWTHSSFFRATTEVFHKLGFHVNSSFDNSCTAALTKNQVINELQWTQSVPTTNEYMQLLPSKSLIYAVCNKVHQWYLYYQEHITTGG